MAFNKGDEDINITSLPFLDSEDAIFTFSLASSCAIHSSVFSKLDPSLRLLTDYSASIIPSAESPLNLYVPFSITSEALSELKAYIYSGKYPPPSLSEILSPATKNQNIFLAASDEPLFLRVSTPHQRQISPSILVQLFWLARHLGLANLEALVAKQIRGTLDKNSASAFLAAANDGIECLNKQKTRLEIEMLNVVRSFGITTDVVGLKFETGTLETVKSLVIHWVKFNGGSDRVGSGERKIKVRGVKKVKDDAM
ncbi:hypothetical protein HK096_000650 [Nowakowskiella sp. JEL0078]|nr:hypothetical protein HK096_000650 [Nowakowskiella sp. JEL0078]